MKPFFIVACGRSGTTLLRAMLTSHSQLAVPRASHFVVEIHERFGSAAPLNGELLPTAVDWLLGHERVADLGVDTVRCRERMRRLERPDVAGLCRVVFEEYAILQGKPTWGDKTTTYGRHTRLLATMFPEARFIHLYRDGRDVVRSLMRVPFGSSDVVDATLSWRSTVTTIRDAGSGLSADRYTESMYETLVEHPERELTRICEFLGTRYEPEMLDYGKNVDQLIRPHDRPYHQHLSRRPSVDQLAKWRRDMPRDEYLVVEEMAGKLLGELGYPMSGEKLGARSRLRLSGTLARRRASRARRALRGLPIPGGSAARRSTRRAIDYLNPARMRSRLLRPHENVDIDLHVREAIAWIGRAQDAGEDDGVARGSRIGSGTFQDSYPETTGYIISTLLAEANRTGDDSLRERAVRMGEWEAEIQLETGAVMAGRVNARPRPAVFNTGQVMLGWNALYRVTNDERYLRCARRAAEWLLEIQEVDGNWLKGHSPHAASGTTVYNVRVAWALAETGVLADETSYQEAAARFGRVAAASQRENGWFDDCCLNDSRIPLLHTLAYATRGFLELGLALRDEAFVGIARRTASALTQQIGADGYLPGRFRPDWSPAVSWSCLTGNAQTAIVLWKLATLDGNSDHTRWAERLNDYLMRRHDVSSTDPTLRGGVFGSWPVSGDYCRFEVINWAAKFLVDSLHLQLQVNSRSAP